MENNSIIPEGHVMTKDGQIIKRENAAYYLSDRTTKDGDKLKLSKTGTAYSVDKNGAYRRVTPKKNDKKLFIDFPTAVRLVTKQIKDNQELYQGYKDNIASCFVDSYFKFFNDGSFSDQERNEITTIANQAANNFLQLWVNYKE